MIPEWKPPLMTVPWFVWRFFIWTGIDSRYQWFRVNLRKRYHKPKLDSDGYCVRCD